VAGQTARSGSLDRPLVASKSFSGVDEKDAKTGSTSSVVGVFYHKATFWVVFFLGMRCLGLPGRWCCVANVLTGCIHGLGSKPALLLALSRVFAAKDH
jgi:hypothetical protein